MKGLAPTMRRFACILVAAGAVWLVTGCEPYDFGTNSRYVYVAIGDSITSGNDHPTIVPYPDRLEAMLGRRVVNEGYDGMPSEFGAGVVEFVLETHRPGYLLILYGANDIIFGIDTDELIANLRRLIREARDNKTIPVLATLLPTFDSHEWMAPHVTFTNLRIRELARDEGVFLVDLEWLFDWNPEYILDDGLHPSESGTQLIADSFYEAVRFIEVIVNLAP